MPRNSKPPEDEMHIENIPMVSSIDDTTPGSGSIKIYDKDELRIDGGVQDHTRYNTVSGPCLWPPIPSSLSAVLIRSPTDFPCLRNDDPGMRFRISWLCNGTSHVPHTR